MLPWISASSPPQFTVQTPRAHLNEIRTLNYNWHFGIKIQNIVIQKRFEMESPERLPKTQRLQSLPAIHISLINDFYLENNKK